MDNFGLVGDIDIKITVEIGRTMMKIEDILNLGKNSIVQLDSFEGQLVKIFVGGKLFGLGEVVTVEESYGVRIVSKNL